VDVELQPDRLTGYITRLGDRESDEGTPLTFFFATSRLAGQRFSFTTRQVHGVWFSFEGTIVRGNARSRDQQGYYLLEGRLVLHDVAFRPSRRAWCPCPWPANIQTARFLHNGDARCINTMRCGTALHASEFPNSPQEEFVWIAQQAQCGTAA